MARFRARCETEKPPGTSPSALSLDEVRQLAQEVFQPAHFFVRSESGLEWTHQPAEEMSWEVYRGRLLDSTHTRQRQTFETWNIFWPQEGIRPNEPILSLKLDLADRQLHVTRAVQCYAWEAYDAGGNVILSRESRKWVRELVGTVALDHFSDPDDLRDELVCLLFQAVAGSSRLPLTSVEAPLPGFSLGRFAYFYRSRVSQDAGTSSLTSFRELLTQGLHSDLSWLEKARLLETVLRSITAEQVQEVTELFTGQWQRTGHPHGEVSPLCRTVFNEVALSPYTGFVERFLDFWSMLVKGQYVSLEEHADFLSYLLRQNARHLTAYDLITFHHRGANYPDALLLDAVLRENIRLIDAHPELFCDATDTDGRRQWRRRLRRRGLRQGWLMWHLCQGLPVPNMPTSPGENVRILPPPFSRVPDEQISTPSKRTKRLFAGQCLPLATDESGKIFQECIADLRHPEELQELGMALFLDRPLGVFKAPGEPDHTVLLSHEAFSRSIAERRLQILTERLPLLLRQHDHDFHCRMLRAELPSAGAPLPNAVRTERPGSVSVYDALKVAHDFVFLRTTRQATHDFLNQFNFAALEKRFALDDLLDGRRRVLILPAPRPDGQLTIYDSRHRSRLELQADVSLGYATRAGQEYPRAGLRVLRVWRPRVSAADMEELDVCRAGITVLPRV